MFSSYEWFLLLEYLTLGGTILVELGFILVMRDRARKGEAIHLVLVFQLALMICSTVTFAVGPWSWFHLLWLVPACVLASFVGFALFGVPLLGFVLKTITLTWARVFLAGLDATVISGTPEPRR